MKFFSTIFFVWLILGTGDSIYGQSPIVVSRDGLGDGKTIRQAGNSLPEDPAQSRVNQVKKGMYKETLNKDSVKVDRVAERMVSYQRHNGGWPKHFQGNKVDYHTDLSAKELEILEAGYESGIDATIDNDATTKEIRYLVKSFKNTGNKKYLQSAEKGIAYLLKAQYSNGGWPQYYPDFSSYRSEVTFNDDAMVNVLFVLDDIARRQNGLEVIGADFIKPSVEAIQKAIGCIVRTQVKQNGQLTSWCAQYDAVTLLPATARKYELPSLSGNESVGILQFLMTIDQPSAEIIEAVNAGVAWFEKSAIEGYKFAWVDAPATPKGMDKVLLPEAGSVIWARFYDLQTNEPFFCGRDGIMKKSITEVEYERRTGYAWYGNWPANLLEKEYPEWRKKWRK